MLAVAVSILNAGLAWCVVAAAATPPPRVVTLDEALAAADAVPEVIAAKASERGADAGIRDAKAPGNPSLSIATKSVTAKESVSVSLPFRWGGQKAAAVSQAQAERDAAGRFSEAVVAAARRACRVAWFTLAAGEDGLRAATELVERTERNRRAVADLLEVERASRLDAARATTEAAMAKATRVSAEQAVTAASAELRALLGIEDGPLSAGDARPAPPDEGALAAWSERARLGSPGVAIAEAELRAAEARVDRRVRENRPLTSLDAGADWNDPTQPGTDVTLGLGITFPTHGRAAVDLARAERDRAAALLDLARRRVDAEVETAWSAAGAARQRFTTLDEVARPAAVEAAALTRLAYDEGKLDLFQLLVAERVLADAERDHADAYRAWGVAFAELERLAPEARP
jgi:outer membrane protein TolC